jgi:hypothetical protein
MAGTVSTLQREKRGLIIRASTVYAQYQTYRRVVTLELPVIILSEAICDVMHPQFVTRGPCRLLVTVNARLSPGVEAESGCYSSSGMGRAVPSRTCPGDFAACPARTSPLIAKVR